MSYVMLRRELEKAAKGLHIIGIRFSALVQLRVDFMHEYRGAVRWRKIMSEL